MVISFKTLGCKTNQAETAALQTMLTANGHRIAAPGEAADAVIINTCAVTAESSRKSRQAIRKARADHPGCIVAVCGCLSQLDPAEVESLEADLIGGSGNRAAFVEELERIVGGGVPDAPHVVVQDTADTFEILPAGSTEGRSRALLKVQDGCDNHCTYCIIPAARGSVRSMPLDTAVEQARGLAEEGCKELVITGIEISSYGKEAPNAPDIIALIDAICTAVPALRIRLGSLEPRTITADFCGRLSGHANFCPHFHLSLQSGSNEVLKRMGRRYDTGRYLESLTLLRDAFQNCAVTTDLIVGFPGESEADFDKSLTFLQTCAFSAVHVFPYSARTGTKAAEFPDQVPKSERTSRAKRAGETARELQRIWLTSQIGKIMPVLFETEQDGQSRGHTPNYCNVTVPAEGLENQIRPVQINGISNGGLIGIL